MRCRKYDGIIAAGQSRQSKNCLPASTPVTLRVNASKPVRFPTEIVTDWLESEKRQTGRHSSVAVQKTILAKGSHKHGVINRICLPSTIPDLEIPAF
jgi:hypothetical protein